MEQFWNEIQHRFWIDGEDEAITSDSPPEEMPEYEPFDINWDSLLAIIGDNIYKEEVTTDDVRLLIDWEKVRKDYEAINGANR